MKDSESNGKKFSCNSFKVFKLDDILEDLILENKLSGISAVNKI